MLDGFTCGREKVEHFEGAAYTGTATLVESSGDKEVAELLQRRRRRNSGCSASRATC
jgi:ferritin-like metal-binding protein YciE